MNIEQYNNLAAIFTGKVMDQVIEGYNITYTFRVIKWYKGNDLTELVRVIGARDIGACGFGRLNDSSEYLIYAISRNGNLWTSWCSSLINYDSKIPFDYHEDTVLMNKLLVRIPARGRQKFYDANGKILAAGEYVNGKAAGLWKYYYDGKIFTTGKYKVGLKDSIWTDYNRETGRLESENKYDSGIRTIWGKTYYENGNIYDEVYPIENGRRWIHNIYHNNGRLRVRMTLGLPIKKNGYFREGLLDGSSTEYYENGKLKEEELDYKGFATGVHKFYDEKGHLIKTIHEKTKAEIDKIGTDK